MLSQSNQYLHPRHQQQHQSQQQHQLATQHQHTRSKSEPRHRLSQQHHNPLQNKQSPSSNSVASIRKKWQDKAQISTNLQQHQEVYQHEQQYQREQQRGNSSIDDRWLDNRRRDTAVNYVLPLETKHGTKSQHQQQVVERRSISAPRSDNEYDEWHVLQQLHITPQDAKSMLWDENERLIAVLPKHERVKINDIRGRWLEQKTDDEMEKHRAIHKSPSNTSQSSHRFKTKYLHAAAMAQQRNSNGTVAAMVKGWQKQCWQGKGQG